MFDEGYHHTPLTITDGWRCLYHARVRLLLASDDESYPREAFDILWAAQDALFNGGEVDVEAIWRKHHGQGLEQAGAERSIQL